MHALDDMIGRPIPGRSPPLAPRLGELVCRWPDELVAASRRAERRRQVAEQRDNFVAETDDSGLGAEERYAAAMRVAALNGREMLTAHYGDELRKRRVAETIIQIAVDGKSAGELPPRLAAILAFVDVVTNDPRGIRRAHIACLRTNGLEMAGIAALTRLIAFVNYEASLLADAGWLALQVPRGKRG